ncbi:MAG: hypothetical protein LBE33_03895 [Zoogloeaceae bacterium]|jgi:hypothetical protein|nr:hypothetical protein [Zoogloeaceae bacterium]
MKTLSLGLTLSVLGTTAAVGALGSVEQRVGSIDKKLKELKTSQKAALTNMDSAIGWAERSEAQRYAVILRVAKRSRRIRRRMDSATARGMTWRPLREAAAACPLSRPLSRKRERGASWRTL